MWLHAAGPGCHCWGESFDCIIPHCQHRHFIIDLWLIKSFSSRGSLSFNPEPLALAQITGRCSINKTSSTRVLKRHLAGSCRGSGTQHRDLCRLLGPDGIVLSVIKRLFPDVTEHASHQPSHSQEMQEFGVDAAHWNISI